MRLPLRPPHVRIHPLREIAEGYRFSLSVPQIRMSLMLVAVSSCFGAAYLSLMPAFARDLLHGDAASYGMLMAELEETQHGDEGRAREWMARALRAPRDPAWTADGFVSDHWMPVSPEEAKTSSRSSMSTGGWLANWPD